MSPLASSNLQTFPSKPRVYIVSDISNEPDDAESLCRYLLYSNQFDTQGLVACTSNWMKNRTCPQDMLKIIDAYAGAVDNLNKHVHIDHPYPPADYLRELVRSGPTVYGMAAIGPDVPISPGGAHLVSRLEASAVDPRPLWVLLWGGANTLAEALFHTRSRPDAALLRSRLRVYAISDQDDSAAWIRRTFPEVTYIASVHSWCSYGTAAWTGISGDAYYGFDRGGPDATKISKEWIRKNIQVGPLGSAYPDFMFIPEGDTPTFLYLIQNGLGVSEHPEYGSWGGRYGLVDVGPNGGRHYADVTDRVVGQDGRNYRSSQATVWRWRDAFQNDFAARIRWTMEGDFGRANHAPVVYIGDSVGPAPVEISAEAGSTITLDASRTYDPDGDELTFKWWHYQCPTATQWWVEAEVAELQIKAVDDEGKVVEVTLPGPEKSCCEMLSRRALAKGQLLHLILEVTDNGSPALTTYRRVLIQATNAELRGGAKEAVEALKQVEAPILSPGPGEVLVHVKCTGVCGSDVHFWKTGAIGTLVVEGDCILGHEAAGIVLSTGPDVTTLKPGDRVAIEPGVPCNRCFLCSEGRYNLCEDVAFSGVYPHHGTLQRYKVHPARWLHKLPDGLSYAEGALLEPLSVVLHGVRLAGLSLGRGAVVCGAGPIGLIALAAARASGAHPIVITDLEPRRLEFARGFVPSCRTYRVDPARTPEENARGIRALFGLKGGVVPDPDEYSAPPVVLECTGVESSVCTAAFAVRRGGVVMVIGVGRSVMNNLPFMHLSLAEIDLRFINRYRDTWPAGIACLESGILPDLKKLVTHVFPLEKAIEGLVLASDARNGSIKVQIVDDVDIISA
ncbi:hypothetical protein PpBr36_04040 [Pyricularia pennisetigena]|uniref:hypothetical protein n=1 Tax=Pyricularia pennisetigena TaxID=1578925 RepID=UPI00114D8A5B|nr:hypothetical protein PpBr36_04040 [Pyricularia pennisetigena]TLS27377.1 hypothetical protein PpBr36_04040 [Pyricularia pennisetigena]